MKAKTKKCNARKENIIIYDGTYDTFRECKAQINVGHEITGLFIRHIHIVMVDMWIECS